MDFEDVSATALAVSRFLHYLGATTLFGAALFPFYAFAGGVRPELLDRTMKRVSVAAAATAFLSALLWLCFTAANMSGDVTAAVEPGLIGAVLTSTEFGVLWSGRLALSLVILFLVLRHKPGPSLSTALLSAALLASLALTGHARREAGAEGVVHVLVDAAHLLAAGVWLGALVPIGLLVKQSLAGASEPATAARALARFSGVGIGAVAVLAGTGLVNATLILGSIPALFDSDYGRVLLAKLAAFAAMLGIALLNRRAVRSAAAAPEGGGGRWLATLRRNVMVEQGLGALVLLLVGFLGTMAPPD
jgi:putative copper resistance protein D